MVRVERSNSDVSGGEEALNDSDDDEADEESESAYSVCAEASEATGFVAAPRVCKRSQPVVPKQPSNTAAPLPRSEVDTTRASDCACTSHRKIR